MLGEVQDSLVKTYFDLTPGYATRGVPSRLAHSPIEAS